MQAFVRRANLESEHTAETLALLHELEGLIDCIELHLVCHVLVKFGAPLLVLLHELGYIDATLVATKGRAHPCAARHKLEGARLQWGGMLLGLSLALGLAESRS
jgi:hypothetical protein